MMGKLGIKYNDGAEEWFDIIEIVGNRYYYIRKNVHYYLNTNTGEVFFFDKGKHYYGFKPREWKIVSDLCPHMLSGERCSKRVGCFCDGTHWKDCHLLT